MFRVLLRYTGLIMILAIFIASGLQKITNPGIGAALLAKSNFPKMLAVAGISLTPEQYIYVIQGTGAIFLSLSLFILLGVGRSFFSILMAIGTLIITVAFFLNWEDPKSTSPDNMARAMANVSIAGAFIFVAGSGHRRRKVSEAPRAQSKPKKSN